MTLPRISGSIGVVSAPPAARIRLSAPTPLHAIREDAQRVALLSKRTLDVLFAALLLAVSFPLLAVAALAIRITSPGPFIFRQQRIGLHGREFTMFKLRTMRHGSDRLEDKLAARERGRVFFKKERDRRVTAVGHWLRKYSIDEIPQFYNVLRGDMSLIGPRPLLACDWRNFPQDERRRRAWMRPGITGLWQISGRNLCSDEDRMRLDAEYVDHWTLTLDLKILLRTPLAVLTARGAC